MASLLKTGKREGVGRFLGLKCSRQRRLKKPSDIFK